MKQLPQMSLALALVATCSVASADSSVTLYGRVNTSVESQEIGGERATVMQNNGSRWGLRGKEDLGNGLSALFQLESGFGSDDGSLTRNEVGGFQTTGEQAALFNRESFVGLSGGFGTVRLGRITSPVYFASADYVSLHNHDTGTSSDALFAFQAAGMNNNNTLAYRTPAFAGTTIEVAYSMNTENVDNNRDTTQIAVNYDRGALHLGGGYSVSNNKTVNPSQKDEMGVIRALYVLGDFTFGGYYERAKLALAGSGSHTRDNIRLAGMYALGASEFHANVGFASDWKDVSDSGATQWTLAYNYNLSKRTKVYAFYTELKDDGAGLYVAGGDKFSSLAVGLRHNF